MKVVYFVVIYLIYYFLLNIIFDEKYEKYVNNWVLFKLVLIVVFCVFKM